MDTRLSHSRPRFELGRGIAAERGVTTQPIIEHLDLLKDVLCRLFARAVLAMVDELALERPEEALDTRVVPAVPPSRHSVGHAVRGEQLLVRRGDKLAASIRVVQQPRLQPLPATIARRPTLPTDELHDIGESSCQDLAVEMLQNIASATKTKFLAQRRIAI